MKISIGCDPEFFLWNTETKRYEGAHDAKVPGTKQKPYKLEVGSVQIDGTAVEFGIDPADTSYEFSYNINRTLEEIRSMIDVKYEFHYNPVVKYNRDYWFSLSKDYTQLGCDPDYSAGVINSFMPNPTPKIPETTRTGSGHIHIGWGRDIAQSGSHFWDCAALSRQFSHIMSCVRSCWDNDKERSYYYSISAYRPKPYGVEYRGLSNAWLKRPNLFPWIFETSKALFENFQEGKLVQRSARFYRAKSMEDANKYLLASGLPLLQAGHLEV
jgi:hypothetical protein